MKSDPKALNPALYQTKLRASLHEAGFITEDIEDIFNRLRRQAPEWLENGKCLQADFAKAVSDEAREGRIPKEEARKNFLRDPARLFSSASFQV